MFFEHQSPYYRYHANDTKFLMSVTLKLYLSARVEEEQVRQSVLSDVAS